MPLVTTDTADHIATVTLNRTEKRNALSMDLRDALTEAMAAALADDNVHAIVLTGAGGHFCAGGDIDGMGQGTPQSGRARMQGHHKLVRMLVEAEKPVIAAVEGYAVGAGAGLALLADTIVMAEGGSIGFPFFRIGLVPDYGILFTLPRRVGDAKARQILLYARMIKAQDAVAQGLADEMVPDGNALDTARERAAELARMPPYAFAVAKRQLALRPATLDLALEYESFAQGSAFTGSEFVEGRDAFLEKRKPDFRK